MLFIKINSFKVDIDICNQINDNYVNYFRDKFIFVIFANEKIHL
jgi:hypothetical protein